MPRYHKIKEFQAHNQNVKCCSIGRNSMGVLATGGDDKLVNLWTIGSETRTLSFQGYPSSVESVAFDRKEEVVAAGYASGGIKIFDLSQAATVRSVAGHKCHVRCLDYSKNYLLSGSNDTNVKMWDARTRAHVLVVKGHTAPVVRVRASPDQLWIASADEAGHIKIFDTTAGRVIQEYSQHSHAVTGLEYNPATLLLASSSADKTVKIWDIDQDHKSLVGSTPVEATGIRAITHDPEGRFCFAAVQDGLRLWQWDPVLHMVDNVDIPWTKVNDMVIMNDKQKLVGCSFSSTFVGIWVVDLNQLAPWRSTAAPVSRGAPAAVSGSQPLVQAPTPPAALPPERRASGGLPRVAAPPVASQASDPAMMNLQRQLELAREADRQFREEQHRSQSGRARTPPGPAHASATPPVPLHRPASGHAPSPGPDLFAPVGMACKPKSRPGSESGARPPSPQPMPVIAAEPRRDMVSIGVGVGDSLLRGQAAEAMAVARGIGNVQLTPPGLPLPRNAPYQLGNSPAVGALSAAPTDKRSDKDQLTELLRGSDKTMQIIGQRGATLRTMKMLLQKGDLRGALVAGRRASDFLAVSDVLEALMARPGFGNMLGLDSVPDLVPVLESMLSLPTDKHRIVAIDMGLMVCKSFVPTILEVCHSNDRRLGVDMAYEQRKTKCEAARMVLQGLRNKLGLVKQNLGRGSSMLSTRLLELSEQLAQV